MKVYCPCRNIILDFRSGSFIKGILKSISAGTLLCTCSLRVFQSISVCLLGFVFVTHCREEIVLLLKMISCESLIVLPSTTISSGFFMHNFLFSELDFEKQDVIFGRANEGC